MRIDIFDFDLPSDRIAVRPVRPRDSSRLLVLSETGCFQDKIFKDLPDFLKAGDLLVINDTRVINARLNGERRRDRNIAKIEVNLIKRLSERSWQVYARPGKKLQKGDEIIFHNGFLSLKALVEDKTASGEITLLFDCAGNSLDDAINQIGHAPLPPYIASKRPADVADQKDYQTCFANTLGSVAAPTAGLHFTPQLIERIKSQGVNIANITLHVGPGTFLPVKTEDTDDHLMHEEYFSIDEINVDKLNKTRNSGGRIIAVGTTVLRALESAIATNKEFVPVSAYTNIFLTPGYSFRSADILITNFHLPRSTLFMLVCAFSGLDKMQSLYSHAINSGYRFYSYGDACLLYRDSL
jgi:S-adenosylmethionine:tRNA ribosyltransferase-isomerase